MLTWNQTAPICCAILAAGISLAAWLSAPQRFEFHVINVGPQSRDLLYAADTWTGNVQIKAEAGH